MNGTEEELEEEEEQRADNSLQAASSPSPPASSSGLSRDGAGGRGGGGGGLSLHQHGGQQSAGTGLRAAHGPMDQVQNPHEGCGSPYNHYPNHRVAYGGAGYAGMMSPSRPGNNPLGPAGAAAANHSKAALTASSSPAGGGGDGGANSGGYQRFSGQSPQQHPSGATPTLNQLLTSPSPMMRGYGGGYTDYNNPSTQQPNVAKDVSSQYGSGAHSWGGQHRNHPALSPGSSGPSGGRSQVNFV